LGFGIIATPEAAARDARDDFEKAERFGRLVRLEPVKITVS
jgi:hypothetical protein